MITADAVDAPSQETDLSKLSPALLTIDWLNGDDVFCYLRLIFALASHPNWHLRLDKHGHIARCIGKIPDIWDQDHPPSYSFYLSAFFLRIQVARQERAAPQLGTITSKQWWDLTRMAWHVASRTSDQYYPLHDQTSNNYDQYSHNYDSDVLDDGIEILEALVAATKMHIPQRASRSELEFLCEGLGGTVNRLKWRTADESILSAVRELKDVVDLRLNAEG
ncbi:hypothetical protein EDB19DRAFT_1673979 [Suillus lakei]|nr:hypothetical protein EDB19DRAFT_1673979 [Suillus lakei]